MNYTDIEWCDMTLNPVTGCFHGCPYCYARKQVRRFEGRYEEIFGGNGTGSPFKIHELETPEKRITKKGKFMKAPYPYGFDPTFHIYRLEQPQSIKKTKNIFIGDMADLFGDWVPDEWINKVFKACKEAPQHRYIFLTKNYSRYNELRKKGILPLDTNMYFGVSVTNEKQLKQACLFWDNIDFLSIEPLTEYIGVEEWFIDGNLKSHWKWVIVGAETGNGKGKVIPEFDWVDDIVYYSKKWKIPLFMKNSLAEVWGKTLIQEYPWEGGNSHYGNG